MTSVIIAALTIGLIAALTRALTVLVVEYAFLDACERMEENAPAARSQTPRVPPL